MKATTKDLRLHTRELIAATDRGEEVIITYRGKPRVKLVSLDPEESAATRREGRNPAFGIWMDKDMETDVDEIVRRLRKPRRTA